MKFTSGQKLILKLCMEKAPQAGGIRTAFEKGEAGHPNVYPRTSLGYAAWTAGCRKRRMR